MVDAGVAKECARDVLPIGFPTKLYMNGTLRSWIHYCDLRSANGTQKEHRQIALDIKQLIKQNYPQVYEVISRFG
jgi:thymidylate synthase (FAD)